MDPEDISKFDRWAKAHGPKQTDIPALKGRLRRPPPILYLDIDGVAYCYPIEGRGGYRGSAVEITPNLMGFLKRVHDLGFELRLLTYNPEGGRALLDSVMNSGSCEFRHWDIANVPSCCYNKAFRNGLETPGLSRPSKAHYVDLSRDFLWVEDGISAEEARVLFHSNRGDCYRGVDNREYGALWRTIPWIEAHPITKRARRRYPTPKAIERRMSKGEPDGVLCGIPTDWSIRPILLGGR